MKKKDYLDPPNGNKVTQRDLYEALYKLDQGLSERFNILLDGINGLHGDMTVLRSEFNHHRADGHPFLQKSEIIREEIKLDTKKVALGTAAVTLLSAIVAGFIELGRRLWT